MYITYTYYFFDLHLICIVGIFPLFRLNILFVSDLSYTSLTVYVMIFIVTEIKTRKIIFVSFGQYLRKSYDKCMYKKHFRYVSAQDTNESK